MKRRKTPQSNSLFTSSLRLTFLGQIVAERARVRELSFEEVFALQTPPMRSLLSTLSLLSWCVASGAAHLILLPYTLLTTQQFVLVVRHLLIPLLTSTIIMMKTAFLAVARRRVVVSPTAVRPITSTVKSWVQSK
jgi:hypothetical protein